MRLTLLADGSLGAPALSFMATTPLLAGVAWGPSDAACRDWVGQTCRGRGIAFQAVEGRAELNAWLESTRPDLAIAFGCPWKLTPALLALPRLGWMNLHGGPLPAYRGPQPVFWQIRNGERESALVAHRMDAGLDTGPILAWLPIPLDPDTTHGALTQALSLAAPVLLQQLLEALQAQGEAFLEGARPQGEGRTWPRPDAGDVRIDWAAMDSRQVLALVRACNPWNSGAWTSLLGRPCRITEATLAAGPEAAGLPGSVQLAADGGLNVACRDGLCLRLEILRLEEGFFTGSRLRDMGIGAGATFS